MKQYIDTEKYIHVEKLIEWLEMEIDDQYRTYLMYKENKGNVFTNADQVMSQKTSTIGAYNDVSLYILKQCDSKIKVSTFNIWLKSQLDNLKQIKLNDLPESFYELAMLRINGAIFVYDRVIRYIERTI